MSTINLNKELPYHLFLVYKQLIKNLQQRLDLNQRVISDWLESADFQDESQKLYEDLEEKMLIQISEDNNIRQLRSIYHAEQPLEYLSKHLGWERERCGYLLHKYDNGYHIYCNRYRHLHDPEQNPGSSIESENIPPVNHKFVYKTYQQLIDEKIFETKLGYYQQFLNKVLIKLQKKVDLILDKDYQVVRIRWITNIDTDGSESNPDIQERADSSRKVITLLLEWLRDHPDCFKTKFGLLRIKESGECGERGKNGKSRQNGKSVCDKEQHEEQYLDVFLPRSKTSDYLAEWSDLTQETALFEHFLLKEK